MLAVVAYPPYAEYQARTKEITRALLNLISNGFYAATKRKEHDTSDGYEPTLTGSTKNLGDRVEIRIRDNGTGIPLEVREKMFNPFFTTKPAGEGTGLGLSISHDIIVKQHSGSIEVDSRPGEYPKSASFCRARLRSLLRDKRESRIWAVTGHTVLAKIGVVEDAGPANQRDEHESAHSRGRR